MNSTAETHGIGRFFLRIVWRVFLLLCGIGLFIAGGIAGGLLILNWVV